MRQYFTILIYFFTNIIYCYGEEPFKIYISNAKGNLTYNKLKVGQKVSTLNIQSSTIEFFEDNAFCALPHLKHLYINGCYIPKFSRPLSNCTPDLETVLIDFNEFLDINRNIFNNLKKLKSLRVSFVSLKRVGKDLFEGLDLSTLYLTNCQIENIDADGFSTLPNIDKINLAHNNLKSFLSGTFSNLNKLKQLLLNSNQIDQFDWNQWSILPSLRELDLADNNITNFDVSKVEKYFSKNVYINIGDYFSPEVKEAIYLEAKNYSVRIGTENYYN